jgi:CRP/FNR family cyclic AMP-dependent transcriptional regulator
MVRLNPEALASLPLFEGMNPSQIEDLAPLGEVNFFEQDVALFSQWDAATYLYVLLSGEVLIEFKPHDGDVLPVSVIKPGGVFGWSSVLGRGEYTSSAISLDQAQTLRFRGESLRRLCESHPETGVTILERLALVIADRLDRTHNQVVQALRRSMQPER